jgi:hypothetical protein
MLAAKTDTDNIQMILEYKYATTNNKLRLRVMEKVCCNDEQNVFKYNDLVQKKNARFPR